jgi:hypothetical protein
VDSATAGENRGAPLGEIVFEVRAQDGCDGGSLASLPADVNLGLGYGVPANKSSLTFARWDGGRWSDVTTIPDPNPGNPYVSATIRQTGTYTVYQRQ